MLHGRVLIIITVAPSAPMVMIIIPLTTHLLATGSGVAGQRMRTIHYSCRKYKAEGVYTAESTAKSIFVEVWIVAGGGDRARRLVRSSVAVAQITVADESSYYKSCMRG